MMWYSIQNQFVVINVFAKPNAKKTAIVKIADDALHISLHAKPHDGEANGELLLCLATFLNVPKSKVVLLKGAASKYKRVQVPLSDAVLDFLKNFKIA